jgi:hypothetical protein
MIQQKISMRRIEMELRKIWACVFASNEAQEDPVLLLARAVFPHLSSCILPFLPSTGYGTNKEKKKIDTTSQSGCSPSNVPIDKSKGTWEAQHRCAVKKEVRSIFNAILIDCPLSSFGLVALPACVPNAGLSAKTR